MSEEQVAGSVGSEWGSSGWLTSPSCRAGQGRAGRGWRGLPSPASGYARLPNCLSGKLSFLQIRRIGGFADHLRFLSRVHWLAGWLTGYLN